MLLRACVGPFLLLFVIAADRQQQGDDYAETKAKLERGLAALRAAATDWPDTTVAAIGQRLGTPAACLDFVRQRVRHEPYAGIMRGSQGVLDAAGGNSAELCELLRALIAASGSKAPMRFATSQLVEAEAARLVDAAMLRPASRPAGLPPIGNAAAAAAPPPAIAARLQDAATAAGRMLADANSDLQQLEELLGKATADDRAAAIAAATTHVWLQLEQDGKWVSFDPIADLEPPADAQIVDALPAAWQHLAQLELEVERLQDGKLVRESLFTQQWPVSALQGRAIELMLVPQGLSMQTLLAAKGRSDDFLAQAKGFSHFGVLVAVTGASPQPGKVFDLEGSTKAAATGPIGVGAVDPFRRLPRGGAAAAKSALAGVFLTMKLRSPDGSERQVERALLDRVGAAARAAGKPAVAAAWAAPERVKVALLQRHLLFVPAGATGGIGAAREVLDSMLQQPCLLAALDLEYGKFQGDPGGAFAGLPEAPADLVELSDVALALVEAAIAGDGLAFLARPNLYLHDDTVDLQGNTLVSGNGIDVALHQIAVLGDASASARRLHGCLVSELEGGSLADPGRWAAALLRMAKAHDIALVPVRAAADLGKVEADADARAVMQGELARGNTLLAMAQPLQVGAAACTAWWRVDAAGHVLAVGRDGRGQGGMEGMTVLKDISIPMVRRCMTFVACLNAAVAGGASMQQAGGSCLANAIRDIVKQSLDKAINTFVKDPLSKQALGGDYDKLYKKAKTAWERYQQVQGAGAAASGAGADIGSAYGGKIYLLLVMGRDIADYGSQR